MIIEVIDTPCGQRFFWSEKEYSTHSSDKNIPEYSVERLRPSFFAVCEPLRVKRGGEVLTPNGVVVQLGPSVGSTPAFCRLEMFGDHLSELLAANFNVGDEIVIEPSPEGFAGTACSFFSRNYWLSMIHDHHAAMDSPYLTKS